MGKCYIEFKKVKNKNGEAEFKNIKLKIDGLLIKRSFSIENEEKLIEDLKNKNVTYEKKNGKRVITDKDLVLKYSKKAKEVLKQNKYKKTIFTTATISALALAALSNSKKVEDTNSNEKSNQNIESTKTEENINIDNNEIVINYNEKSEPLNVTYTKVNNVEINNNITNENIDNETSVEYVNNDIINDNTYTFNVNYDDRSDDEIVGIIKEKYHDSIEKYSNMYGIDENLVTAIIIQENKYNEKNYSDVGGYGLMQVESIWDGQELYSYNFVDEEYEKIIVDTARARDDDDYSIKVGCMIYNNYYQSIRSNYCVDDNKLTEEECIIAALFAYNKGIGIIMNNLDNYSNFETFLNDVRMSSGGDDQYIEHVLSYENGKIITNKNIDGSTTSLNVTINNYDNVNIKM